MRAELPDRKVAVNLMIDEVLLTAIDAVSPNRSSFLENAARPVAAAEGLIVSWQGDFSRARASGGRPRARPLVLACGLRRLAARRQPHAPSLRVRGRRA